MNTALEKRKEYNDHSSDMLHFSPSRAQNEQQEEDFIQEEAPSKQERQVMFLKMVKRRPRHRRMSSDTFPSFLSDLPFSDFPSESHDISHPICTAEIDGQRHVHFAAVLVTEVHEIPRINSEEFGLMFCHCHELQSKKDEMK